MLKLLDRISARVLILKDPRPYLEFARHGDLPYYGHPLRKRVKEVLETRIMVAENNRFRGREPLLAKEWVRILERIRTVIDGYRQRVELQTP